MLARLRARLSYANVMATIAVFSALGGVSYAAVNLPKNSVGAQEIAKNAVRAPEIAKNAVQAPEIAKNAVRSGEVKNGSLRCADFRSSEPACQADRVGLTNTVVRTTNGNIPLTCFEIVPGSYSCSGSATIKAPCNAGERATGGGYGPSNASITVTEDRPDPATGTPNAWLVTANAFAPSATASPPPAMLPVYAVCAS